MVGGRIRFDVPMLCCVAFLIQFLCAGITGISHAVVPLDWQTKNSYFLIAHFHFVAAGAILFALMAGVQYWFSENDWSHALGAARQVVFLADGHRVQHDVHHSAFSWSPGMPRRVFTYPDIPHWGWMNMLSTVGAFFMATASLILVWNLVVSFFEEKSGR